MDLGEAEIVPSGIEPDGEAVIVEKGLVDHFKGQNVSISLKYYQKKPECWSDWKEGDLSGFTKVIELLRQQSVSQVRSGGGSPVCKIHSAEPKVPGFTRPKDISEDLPFYELHVHKKARLHGFFVESVFFLVWLDRNHRAFP